MFKTNEVGAVDMTCQLSAETTAYRKATLRLVPFLAVCFLFAYLDRVNISFAKLQMQSELGLSDAAYGLGAGIFFIGYFLFEIPSNIILQRVGARRWIARIMISWGIASALMMFVQNELWFYVLRFIVGATEAGFMPGIVLYFTHWFSAKRRARINAWFLLSIPLSGVLGGPLSGFIMTYLDGHASLPGWQWLFLIEGGITVILGVMVLFLLTDRPSDANWLNQDERAAISLSLALDAREEREHNFVHAIKQKETIFLSAIWFLTLIGLWGLTFWLPELIKQTGVADKMSIGLLTAIPYGAGCVAMIALGRSSDQSGERKKHMGFALLIATVGFIAAGWFGNSTTTSLLALTLAAFGTIGSLPIFWTFPPKILAGSAAAGGIALINSVGNLSGVVSPYLVGTVKDITGSTETALYLIASSTLLAALLVLFVMPAKLASSDRVKP